MELNFIIVADRSTNLKKKKIIQQIFPQISQSKNSCCLLP